jgi:DNA invertase Pin-like site-specific DNA recombinase
MKNEMVIEVHAPIIDLGFGVTRRKPRLKKLSSLVKSRSIDFLYIYDLSRLGRKVTEVFELLQTLKESGVEVKTDEGGINLFQESLSLIACPAIA